MRPANSCTSLPNSSLRAGVYRAGEIVAVEVLPVGVTHDLEAEDPIVVAAML
jgi:hypothetical protein